MIKSIGHEKKFRELKKKAVNAELPLTIKVLDDFYRKGLTQEGLFFY